MDLIPLATTGRQTSRLGFGCSSIATLGTRARGLALLEAAYTAGVRHFDVAPMYGDGEAEPLLGEFLARHPGQCSVATKFGIPPTHTPPLKKLARAALLPVLSALPALKQRLQRAAAAASQPPAEATEAPPNPIFNPAAARAALDRSLRHLRVDRIDLWLLHEAKLQDLTAPAAEGLLRLLEDAVAQGKIAAFGIGSDRPDVAAILHRLPAFAPVTQSEWSIRDQPETEIPGVFRIHHRALSANFAGVMAELRGDPERCRQTSDNVGADLNDPEAVARLMLKASCVFNPASVILFSSKRPAHIANNASVAGDDSLTEPARKLFGWYSEQHATAGVPS